MAVATLVPLEEYLSTSYDSDREYVDGRLIERNVGELDHGDLQVWIAMLLRQRGLRSTVEVRMQVSATRYRIPDVQASWQRPKGRFVKEPPYIVVEVLSRDDRRADLAEKIADYLGFGVPNIWFVDPRKRRVTVHNRDGAVPCRESVQTTDGKISIPLTEIFGDMPDVEE